MREKLNEQEYQDKYACRIQIIEPVYFAKAMETAASCRLKHRK
jgi:hypothetical protein